MKAQLGFRYSEAGGFLPFVESQDGRYFVADTGTALHVDPRCHYLWLSQNEIRDPTRTLGYRVLRGDVINGPRSYRIQWVCLNCMVIYDQDSENTSFVGAS